MYTSERPDKGTIVYVGNLESEVTKEELEAEFGKFGTLNRVWVAFNPPGFAFVEYDKKEDAESAVKSMHDATVFGTKLRVEISRGRGGRGSRGGPGGRGGRGGFRGGHGDFRGGPGGDFGRGRGMLRGRGGFGRPAPYDIGLKPYRGGEFDDFEDRRRPEFPDRDFGGPRDFSARRDFGDGGPRGFGPGRDFPPRDGGRDFPPRDIGGRDFPPRDIGGRDYPSRDIDGRDYPAPRGAADRDFGAGRDRPREFGPRDYGDEREVNGMRGYGGVDSMGPPDKGYGGRDFMGQAPIVRDYAARDPPGPRDFSRDGVQPRDFEGRRESGGVRDFNPPRDVADPRDFTGRPARLDYENERFGGRGGGFAGDAVRRAGAFEGGRYPAGEVGGSGDYGGYNRFRSRSPMGRGREVFPPPY